MLPQPHCVYSPNCFPSIGNPPPPPRSPFLVPIHITTTISSPFYYNQLPVRRSGRPLLSTTTTRQSSTSNLLVHGALVVRIARPLYLGRPRLGWDTDMSEACTFHDRRFAYNCHLTETTLIDVTKGRSPNRRTDCIRFLQPLACTSLCARSLAF